jgi:hypothetical protein
LALKTKIEPDSSGAARTTVLMLLAIGIAAILSGIGLVYSKHLSWQQKEPSPVAEVHGEPIQAVAVPATNPVSDITTNTPTKRRHPKPPSVQRRMLLAQLAQTGAVSNGDTSLPSGTLGNAADMAKTNLVSASSLPPVQERIPGYAEINFSTLSGFDFVLDKEMADGSTAPTQMLARAKAEIPANVLALDGAKSVIQGFLLPVKITVSRPRSTNGSPYR